MPGLVRQKTHVGHLSGRGKRNNVPYRRNVMRKTSRRGAYKKGKKKAMAIRRAPLVETKRKDAEQLRSPGFFAGSGSTAFLVDHTTFTVHDTEHVMMDPLTYFLWSQGLDQSQHIGQAVNLKYTNMKLQVRFPQPSMQITTPDGTLKQEIPSIPQKYELIWGWVPAPFQLTGTTSPAANTVTATQLLDHVNHRVTDYFNSRKDRLRFIPKKDATLRIIGRRTIRPDMRYQSTAPASIPDATKDPVGTIPDYFTEISWKHNNRKVWLEQTGNINGNSDLIAMYPNYAWLPFCTLVNWNYDELSNTTGFGKKLQCPSVCWNDITYFTDS